MVIQSFQMPIGNGQWEWNFFNGYFSPIAVESDDNDDGTFIGDDDDDDDDGDDADGLEKMMDWDQAAICVTINSTSLNISF